MRDVFGVLKNEIEIERVYCDEHHMFWKIENDEYWPATLMANKIFILEANEMIIGGSGEIGEGVEKVWPLMLRADENYDRLQSVLEYGGFQIFGTNSNMAEMCENKDLNHIVFRDIKFDKSKSMIVNKEKWNISFLKIEDEIARDYKFPLEVKYDGQTDKIMILENFTNIMFKIYEEGFNEVKITEQGGLVNRLLIGFIGRKNFLPSRVVKFMNDKIEVDDENKQLNRELQDFVINFVKKYDVRDYGLFEINLYPDGWRLLSINFAPDLSRESMFAKLWNLSGMSYEKVIRKIYQDAMN
jgi:D-alanine-D-alanine ligase-like ATP-grasp enzyme